MVSLGIVQSSPNAFYEHTFPYTASCTPSLMHTPCHRTPPMQRPPPNNVPHPYHIHRQKGCGCWTPLQLLCSEGDVRGVALLLSLDAEPGKRVQADDQCTALHIAARFGFAPIVEILAKAGAGTDARDKQGHTPLHFAAVNGHEASVQALLARGAYAHLVDAGGNTALDMAQQAGHSGIVKLLQQNLGEHGGTFMFCMRRESG